MLKKATSIGFTALMILSALVVLDIIPIENVSAIGNPVWNPNGYYETASDWTVDGSTPAIWADTTIVVNGDLTIPAPFSLTFYNVTLKMNCTSDGQYTIDVEDGGGMYIYDSDNDPTTTADASVITSGDPAFEYAFVVRGTTGSNNFEMMYSELHECGWTDTASATEYMSGLQIMTGGAIIFNNTISDCYRGIVLYNANNVLIEGNVISSVETTAIWGSGSNWGITIQYNRIYGPITARGIFLNNTNSVDILYNTIDDLEFMGIAIFLCDDVNIDHNTITNVSSLSFIDITGIYAQEMTNSYITNNTVYRAEFYGIWVALGCYNVFVYNNLIKECLDSNSYAIVAASSDTVNLTNNDIVDNPYMGIFLTQNTDVSAYQNTINDCLGFGLYVTQNSGSVDVVDNTIQYNHINLMFHDQDGFYAYGNDVGYGGDTGWFSNEGGVTVYECSNGIFYQNYVHDNYIMFPVARFRIIGYWIYGSSNIIIEDETIENNQVNVCVYGDDMSTGTSNLEIINSTLIDGFFTDFDINITAGPIYPSYCTLLNTTWTNSSIDWDSTTSELTVQWFLNVKTTYGGTPIPNVNVWANDTFGTNEGQGTTGPTGWVEWLKCTEYIERDTNGDEVGERTYHTPHNITAKEISGTREGFVRPYLGQSRWITIPLNYRPEVLDLNAFGEVFRKSTIYFYANGSDFEEAEFELTPHFEYRDPNELSWNTSYFDFPEYITSAWRIPFTPLYDAPIGLYDVRIRFEDSYGSYSDWSYSYDSINVLNNQPWVEYMYNETPSIPGCMYRGENAWVFASGYDVENGDDSNLSNAEFEYMRPGEGTWGTNSDYWTTLSGYDPSYTDWKQRFTPSNDAPVGIYGFRARVQDNDGDWSTWEHRTNITVENKPPQVLDLTVNYTVVYRGDSVWLYANATDDEEPEENLTVEFWYDAPGGGPSDWENASLNISTLTYNTTYGIWMIQFSPPYTESRTGYYRFRVRVNDSYGSPDELIEPALVEVLNNFPDIDDLTSSKPTVIAGAETIFIYINATDLEDLEDILDIQVQWQYNETPAGWFSDYLGVIPYYGTPPDGWIRVSFSPPSGMQNGTYDFRARVRDMDNDYSDWIYNYQCVEVVSPSAGGEPIVVDVTPETDEMNRTETIFIIVNAYDANDPEAQLTLYVQYDEPGGGVDWVDYYLGTAQYVDTNSNLTDNIGYWQITFTPLADAKPGNYQFRAQVMNMSGNFSEWLSSSIFVSVNNNLPEAIDLRAGAVIVERGKSVSIMADGFDVENLENQLSVFFEYRDPNEISWNITYFGFSSYQGSPDSGSWQIQFSLPAGAPLGLYDFRVWFVDNDTGSSNVFEILDLLEVVNGKPVVLDLSLPSWGYVLQTIYVTTNGSDAEITEDALTPTFQYQYDSTGIWIEYGDPGSYFQGPPQYIGGVWRIPFRASDNADLGLYSFRLKFSDGIENGSWLTLDDSFTLMSWELRVDDLTVPSSGYRLETVYISANATDPGGSEDDLIPTFEYNPPDSTYWVSQGDSGSYLSDSAIYINGFWRITFLATADAGLGLYSFRVQFYNGTDTTDWYEEIDSFDLMNNVPEVESLSAPTSEYRLEKIYITADGFDEETSEDALIPTFQHKSPSGSWVSHDESGSYFNGTPQYISGSWRIEFIAPANAELGFYSFQVQFSDGVAPSEWGTLDEWLNIMNNVPSVIDLEIPTLGYRIQRYYITTNATDLETGEEHLSPTFQFKTPTGTWISHRSSDSYFTGAPQYIDDYWVIEFQAPADAQLGLYSFQVRFSDSIDYSDWNTQEYIFNIRNNIPKVTITNPLSGLQNTSRITFTANASDAEDPDLNYSWDFGDGESSQEVSPTHDYSSSGEYTITLIVTDDDGATATTTLSITVTIPESEPDGKEEESNYLNLLLILIIVVVVIILLLLFLMKRRKSEPEALPPPQTDMPLESYAPPTPYPHEAPPPPQPQGEIPAPQPEEAPQPEVSEDLPPSPPQKADAFPPPSPKEGETPPPPPDWEEPATEKPKPKKEIGE